MSNINDEHSQKCIPNHKQKKDNNEDDKLDNDIVKLSHAMDVMAKIILEKRKQSNLNNVKMTNTMEYDTKLKNLNDLINMILRLNSDKNENNNIVDTTKLDILLRNKVDIIEKDGQSYALIPIKKEDTPVTINNINNIKKKSNKKKKNKILCSFCHEPGHTRAHCEKRLYSIPQ
ncbi:hypothetical protein MOUN0_E04478 [Monosporozyma unispora]|nr:hypothetical protein C6P44_000522 [Kazachstania unispora]